MCTSLELEHAARQGLLRDAPVRQASAGPRLLRKPPNDQLSGERRRRYRLQGHLFGNLLS